jgi:hypothetical protein
MSRVYISCGYPTGGIDEKESQIFNYPGLIVRGESIMVPFERVCIGSAVTGFVVLVVTTAMWFVV